MALALLERPPPLGETINSLRELLGRMPTLVIRPAFEPADWAVFDPESYVAENAMEIKQLNNGGRLCPWCGMRLHDEGADCDCGAVVWGMLAYDPKLDMPKEVLDPPPATKPHLSLGSAHVPRRPQQIVLDGKHFEGRIIRIPVTNAAGADTAKSVQVQLTFCPDDTTGWMSPRNPALAEWDTELRTTMIDIPGNGQPQLFDVALILEASHICIYQWTRHSREAKLDGYGIAGKGVIRVDVRAAGDGGGAPEPLTDTLHIEAIEGSLYVQWESEGLGTRKNGVPWTNPPRMPGRLSR
jgi:hypothetical protein